MNAIIATPDQWDTKVTPLPPCAYVAMMLVKFGHLSFVVKDFAQDALTHEAQDYDWLKMLAGMPDEPEPAAVAKLREEVTEEINSWLKEGE